MARNPFLNIVPSEDEPFIETLNMNEVEAKLRNNNILLIVGEVGSGKSHLILELKRRFGGKVIYFSSKILDEIREVKEGIVYLEDFDLINGFPKEFQDKLIQLIKDKSELGVKFVIEITPKVEKKLNIQAERIEIPKIDFELAKKIIEQKLQKEGVKNVFDESELKNIWKKSGENPRLFLMLLATMYDLKVNS